MKYIEIYRDWLFSLNLPSYIEYLIMMASAIILGVIPLVIIAFFFVTLEDRWTRYSAFVDNHPGGNTAIVSLTTILVYATLVYFLIDYPNWVEWMK